MSSSLFALASAAEIIRSAEKDKEYRQQLKKSLSEVSSHILSRRNHAIFVAKHLAGVTDLLYYGLTTVVGQQTPGEEYSEIVLFSGQQFRVHIQGSPVRRLMYCLIKAYGEGVWSFVCNKMLQRVRGRNRPLGGMASRIGLYVLALLALTRQEEAKRFLSRFHLGIFYLYSTYYELSKRLVSLRYFRVSKNRYPLPSYRVLGVVLLAQLLIGLFLSTYRILSRKGGLHSFVQQSLGVEEDDFEEEWMADERGVSLSSSGDDSAEHKSRYACALCLNSMRHPTCTVCGHVFCWRCIAQWTATKAECPLCRQPIEMRSLVALYHYE
ncbi:hypothetical protein GAYE_SCF51G6067 [Galdieria yellowstonensis]|uniref:RING-type E3 ubiquitin transferase n=1 Tax=Galdieria yellowstonensis TaxID=3028027 RepID=A0AAV9ILG3_9RHOD|nr:hypothetical protein GAYE_SCF51G6067 [Galdieria yellowstonensis]